MKRRWVAAALVVIVALLGLFAVLSSNEGRDSGADVMRPAGAANHGGMVGDDAGAGAKHDVAARAGDELPVAPPRAVASLPAAVEFVTVRGRVTGTDGAPLKGARVGLVVKPEAAAKYPASETDANGNYELAIRAEGTFAIIRAQAPEHAEEQVWIQVVAVGPRLETLDFVLARIVQLEGRVTWADDGTPCAGATVVVKPVFSLFTGNDAKQRPALGTLVTDADGAFRCALPGARVVSAEVTPAPDSSAAAVKQMATTVTIPLPTEGEPFIAVELLRPAFVTVVLRESPADASGLRMLLTPHELPAQERSPGAPAPLRTPVVNGEAAFGPVPPGVAWDVVLAQGRSLPVFLARGLRFAAGEHARIEFAYDPDAFVQVPPPAPPETAAPTMSFRVRFVDGSGSLLQVDEFTQLVSREGDMEVVAEARSLTDGSIGSVRMRYDSGRMEGSATVFGAAPPIEMTLKFAGGTVIRSPIESGDTVEVPVLLQPQAATLTIRGTDARGQQRVPGLVYVVRCDTWAEERVVVVHSRSEPVVTLEAGAYLVWAQVEQQETQTVRVELAPGEARTLVLSAGAPGTLRGVLYPPPAAGECATVQAMPAGGGAPLLAPRATVGADGRFEFPALPADTWDLACLVVAPQGAERGPERLVALRGVHVASGVVTDVVMENASAPAGQVLLQASVALPMIYVALRAADGSLQFACPMLAGERRRLRLPAGRYTWQSLDPERDGGSALQSPQPFELSADSSAPELVIDV